MLNLNKKLNRLGAVATAAIITGITSGVDAHAQSSFNDISARITTQISNIPGLLTAMSYMFGLLLAILGLVKIKDHVENPSQTPLKEGAIRLCIGGALFAIPLVTGAMQDLVNAGGNSVDVNRVKMQKISTFNAVN